MMGVAKKFMGKSETVTIGGKEYQVKQQTIRHNLKFISLLTDAMKEGNNVFDMEWTDKNVVSSIMGLIEDKLTEFAQIIVPDVTEEDVLDSYFDEWAEALEAYLRVNFSKAFGAFQKAMAVQNKVK